MTTDSGMDVSPRWQELKYENARLVRVNHEQQALLDEVWRYVDESGLAKLGQSRVTRLIEAHREASAHNARLKAERDALAEENERIRKGVKTARDYAGEMLPAGSGLAVVQMLEGVMRRAG